MSDYFLTATDIRALRRATDVCFDRLADGTSQVRAIHRRNYDDESTVTIPVTARLENYGPALENWSGFHMEMNVMHSGGEWQTIANALRPGMEIVVRWVRDNNSPVLRDAGLVADDLHVVIHKDGAPRAAYLIHRAVGRDNTARMIRSVA